MKSTYTLLIVILSFSVFQLSCSEDSSSSDGTPPEVPQIVGVTPNVTYFENGPSIGSSNEENSNFASANLQATTSNLFLSSVQVYNGFLVGASTEDADLNDGVWTWTYAYSFEGSSAEIVVTSEERGGRIYWDMSWTYNDGETVYEDYTILEGSIATDYQDGEWTANDLYPETNVEVPALVTEWEFISDTEESMTVELREDGQTETVITYSKNGVAYLMTIDSSGKDLVEIGWNEDTGTGYYQQGGAANRMCWDSDYVNVACP